MTTKVLLPNTYSVSSSKLTVADENNMYTNTSSTTYGTVTNTNNSTSYYYFYLKGFNVTSIPRNAEISSLSIKIRGNFSGGYVASLYLSHGTTTISNATASSFSSSLRTKTFTIPNTLTWSQIYDWGDEFGIRINCRRNKKNTTGYWYVYGAEIDVTYTEPTQIAYIKSNGVWVPATHLFKKTNGSWIEQVVSPSVFDSNVRYKGS